MGNLFTNFPSRQAIISKSTLLQTGPPARYQLQSKILWINEEDKAGTTLSRWTFGERDPSKPNKTILVVGETGTGKSTLINAMVNFVMGVEWEDKIWFEIVEEGKRSQSESQTSEVTVYEIFGFEGKRVPFSLTVIDTPGYGDTRGIQQDAKISQAFHDLLRSDNGIHEIDAVGLVVKATQNRISDRQWYIFDAMTSLFGKDLDNNIVALLTHSDGGEATNALQAFEDAEIKCAKDEYDQSVNFLFNNRRTEFGTNQGEERALRYAWDTTTDGMKKFFKFLSVAVTRNLTMTSGVLEERAHLSARMKELEDTVQSINKSFKGHPVYNWYFQRGIVSSGVKGDSLVVQKEIDECLREVYQCIFKLEEIALNPDSLSTYIHLDFLIEKMKESGDSNKAERLGAIKRRAGNRQAEGMKYMWAKLG